ncbi:MAG: formimidoylglutamate deiminase [Persicimonas sp.]
MQRNSTTYYRAPYILDGLDWLEDGYLAVDDGRVVDLVEKSELPKGVRDDQMVDLGRVALVPGLVNAHSHAFQRAIRGRTEYVDAERREDDFWTWRDQMYGAALSLDADQLEAVSRMAFLEMAAAGITTVGEFHYVHHRPDGRPYDDPNELAHRVIRAARDVGVRISLLRVAYHRGGHDRPAEEKQRRFVEPDVETYLERVEALRERWAKKAGVTVGLAPHSIRAVPSGWLEAIGAYADEHGLPLHIHACEQRREIEESRAEYGASPIAVFEELGLLDDHLTIVHGTHVTEDELELLGRRKPTICACPTTERNLGDGFLPALELAERGVPVCLGSDSHTNIDLFEEMRLVEYHERLRRERRNVLAEDLDQPLLGPDARRWSTARALWPMGSLHGARALQLPVGCLEPGCAADFVALDLDHLTMVGAEADSLLAYITLSMTPDAVRDVYVAGEPIIEERHHERRDEIATEMRSVVSTLA